MVPACRQLTDKSRLLFVDRVSLQTCVRSMTLSAVNRGAERNVVDMRSDVLTKPTPRMLQAMTQASLDDDVFREDRATLGKSQMLFSVHRDGQNRPMVNTESYRKPVYNTSYLSNYMLHICLSV